ncbi:MAG: tyrosine-type recombinase/integrase [archaeon]
MKCPLCDSDEKVIQNGWRYDQETPIHRFYCKKCDYRFSDTNVCIKMSTANKYSIQQSRGYQICETFEEGSKNLGAKQPTEVLQETKTKEKLVNFGWWLIKNGRSEYTAKSYIGMLNVIAKRCSLNDPEEVKSIIAKHFIEVSTKKNACCAYTSYLKYVGGTWTAPKYKPPHKQKFIPTESELRLAINSGTKESVVFSMFCYETGARKNEAQRLEWTDLDREHGTVSVKASKHCYARTLPISKNLMDLLFSFSNKSERVFPPSTKRSASFSNRMKRLAKKYNNPRFKKITLHTFRHCFALRTYHRTRDTLSVMEALGHKKLDTTHIYIRLYNQIYKAQRNDEFITKIASTKEKRCELIANGWELVATQEDDWYFRKRK